MKILRYISILPVLALILAGCGEKQNMRLKEIEFSDLLPKEHKLRTDKTVVSLFVYMFEIDKNKYPQVLDGLKEANDLSVKYYDWNNFAANGLVSGGGDMNTWGILAKNLADADALVAKRTSVLMDLNSSEEIEIAELTQPGSVSYCTADKAWAEIGLPKGSVVLEISTKSLIGLKQSCKLEIKPVYKTADRKISGWEFAFDSIAVSAAVRPGQFVFLAPDTENVDVPEQTTGSVTGKMIFCSVNGRPVVRFCLIACGLINY